VFKQGQVVDIGHGVAQKVEVRQRDGVDDCRPEKMAQRLGLNFDIDDWQGELIRRLCQGYDSLLTAGTGYGKSIIF
jgi:hypothetical protein